jgi:hypothetical protein
VQVQQIEALKLATTGNLALCCMQLELHAEAVDWCSKGLELEAGSAKLLLRWAACGSARRAARLRAPGPSRRSRRRGGG